MREPARKPELIQVSTAVGIFHQVQRGLPNGSFRLAQRADTPPAPVPNKAEFDHSGSTAQRQAAIAFVPVARMYSFAPICCVSGGCVPSVVNTSVFRFAGRCASRTLEKFLASDRRPDLRSSAELISRCRGWNPAASTSQSVSNASHMKVAQKPRGTARFRRCERVSVAGFGNGSVISGRCLRRPFSVSRFHVLRGQAHSEA